MNEVRCNNCGCVWHEDELKRVREPHGEILCWCPACGAGELVDLDEYLLGEDDDVRDSENP